MRIVFMGTPEFAVPCLRILAGGGDEVAAVFSQPDRPKGRGYKTVPTPVKAAALEYSIPVCQPGTLRDGEAQGLLSDYAPEVIVVVAYGRILPPSILGLPKYGCVNLHASLLPKFRGASPIQSAVLAGETRTGVTAMLMNEGMDTGDILKMSETPIDKDETAIELAERLSLMGAEMIIPVLRGLSGGSIIPKKQEEALAIYAPMLKKEMGRVDWSRPALDIHNQIRGLQPWPAAYTSVSGKTLKLWRSRVLDDAGGLPGEILRAGERMIVSAGQGAIELLEVQLEGSKRMPAAAMLRGLRIREGDFLG